MNFTSVNEIRANFAEIQEQASEIISYVTDSMAGEARVGGNMDWVQHCAKTVESLNRDQEALLEIERRLVDVLENTLGFESDKFGVSPAGLRELTIEVSQGMINQHLLTLTHAKRLGKVKLGEEFNITLPDGTNFTTDLCDPGNKLRERGLIRQFYEKAGIKDGDKALLSETSPGAWQLTVLTKEAESAEGLKIIKEALSDEIPCTVELVPESERKPLVDEPSGPSKL
jgi:hypothetical protein